MRHKERLPTSRVLIHTTPVFLCHKPVLGRGQVPAEYRGLGRLTDPCLAVEAHSELDMNVETSLGFKDS